MLLDPEQIERLLSLVASTHEDEIPCDHCWLQMGEFAEAQLRGLEIGEALRRVENHLESCPDCAEEYALLLRVLRASGEAG